MSYFTNGGSGSADVIDAWVSGPDVLKDGSDRYIGPPHGYNIDVSSLTADTIYYTLTRLPAGTYTRICVGVTTSGAGTLRLGAYNVDSTTGGPGTLISDFGTVDVSVTGVKELTISQAFTAAPFYIAIISDVTPTIRANNTTVYDNVYGYSDISQNGRTTYLSKASSSAEHTSLSSTALSSLTGSTGSCPRVCFRVV